MIAVTPGQVLGGRYRLEQVLGAGTVALVYEARDEQLERQVAVKILRPEWAQDPPTAAAFEREAQAAAGLHHPHLAQIYDAGAENGTPYIVMERVPGAPLDPNRRLAPAQVVDLGAQIAGALAFVHDHGLLHCDIKPANLLVDPAGQVKLVDFGVACPVDEPPPAGQTGEAGGATLRLPAAHAGPDLLPYLAPERLVGGPPSPAADVYSLGAILYTVLAGRPPFPGATPEEIAAAQRAGAPPALRDRNPAVPPALEAAVARAVAVDPAQRFATARDMEAALEAVRAESRAHTAAVAAPAPLVFAPSSVTVANPVPPNAESTGANPLPASAAQLPAASANSADPAPAPYRPAIAGERPLAAPAGANRRQRWVLPVTAGVLLLALLIAGMALARRGQSPTQAAAPPVTAPPGATVAADRPAPQFMGLTLEQARAAAQQDGWTLVEAPAVYNNSVRVGLILAQQPEMGTPIAPGAPITVTASLGAQAAAPTPAPAVNNNPPPAPPAAGGNKDKGSGNDKGKGNDKGNDKGKGNDKKK